MNLLVIVGINGRQGASVANAFMDDANWAIRGLTSSPDCAASQFWRNCGVEIVQIDLHNLDSIRACFAGADAIFAVTDYYTYLNDYRLKMVAFLQGKCILHAAAEQDAKVGLGLLTAAAQEKGLKNFVLSSPSGIADYSSPASLKGAYQLKSKATVLKHLERNWGELKPKTTALKTCFRMEDYRSTLQMKKDGTLQFGTTAPGYARLPWINITKDFGTFARALILGVHPDQDLATVSEWLSGDAICAYIAKISGMACRYYEYSQLEMEALAPSSPMTDLLAYSSAYHYWEQATIHGTILEEQYNLNIPRTGFEKFLKEDLSQALEDLGCVSVPDGMIHIWATDSSTSPRSAEKLSEKVMEVGYQATKKVNHKSHDRHEPVGNHPM